MKGDTCDDTMRAGSVDDVDVTSAAALELLDAPDEAAIRSGLTGLVAVGAATGAEWFACFGGAQHSSAPAWIKGPAGW